MYRMSILDIHRHEILGKYMNVVVPLCTRWTAPIYDANGMNVTFNREFIADVDHIDHIYFYIPGILEEDVTFILLKNNGLLKLSEFAWETTKRHNETLYHNISTETVDRAMHIRASMNIMFRG